MAVNNFHAFVVNLQVFVYFGASYIGEKILGASNLAHGCPFAGVLYFCEKHWRRWAVLIILKVSCVFCTHAKISSSPESRDYAYVFVLVTPQPSCVLFAFDCTVLCKTIQTE